MKCEYIKTDGTKCEANAINKGSFCYFHSPDVSDEDKREAQSNGGKTKALTLKTPLPEMTLAKPDDAILLISDTIKRVRAGELDIRTANCLGFLTDKLLKAFEVAKLNDKLEFLEQSLRIRER
jgi:hypothetical protein